MSLIARFLYILKKILDLWSMPILRAISSSLFVKYTYQLDSVSPTFRQSNKGASMYLWVLIVHT